MRKVEFNFAHRRWDQFGAFHTVGNMFVHFETGEFGVLSHPKKPERHVYKEYGVALTSTLDKEYKFLTMDGAPIPQSHLVESGGQDLLIDLDHKVVVSLGRFGTESVVLPNHLQRMLAYYDNTVAVNQPKSGRKTLQVAPFVATKEQKEWVAEVNTGAEALYVDLGHFGRKPIIAAWLFLVFPCLLLNYFG